MPNTYSELRQIPTKNYQGYFWSCQEKSPEIIKTDTSLNLSEYASFPFIMEGLLLYKKRPTDKGISISIKHTGSYHIVEYDLDNLPEGSVLELVSYVAHRLDGIEQVYFYQFWEPVPDPACANFPVLTFKTLLFAGFTSPEKTNHHAS